MRIIEQNMNTAIRNRQNFSSSNTMVRIDGDVATVFLHGNKIAEVSSSFVALFDGGWQSNTTKSRLNAICEEFRPHTRVFQKNWQWFISTAKGNKFDFISGSLV